MHFRHPATSSGTSHGKVLCQLKSNWELYHSNSLALLLWNLQNEEINEEENKNGKHMLLNV